MTPETGVLDEPYSANPAQRSSHTGPPGCIGLTRLQPMYCRLATPLAGLADNKVRLLFPACSFKNCTEYICTRDDHYIMTPVPNDTCKIFMFRV